MEAFGASLALIGAVCVVAAIVGGNVRLPGAKFGAVESRGLRWLLGSTGLVFLLVGFAMLASIFPTDDRGGPPGPSPTTEPSTSSGPSVTNDPSNSPSKSVRPSPDNRQAEKAYRTKAESVCQRAGQRIGALQGPNPNDDPSGIEWAVAYTGELQRLANELEEVSPPGNLSDMHVSIIANVTGMSKAIDTMGIAIGQGDGFSQAQADQEYEGYRQNVNRFAGQLGIPGCHFEG